MSIFAFFFAPPLIFFEVKETFQKREKYEIYLQNWIKVNILDARNTIFIFSFGFYFFSIPPT